MADAERRGGTWIDSMRNAGRYVCTRESADEWKCAIVSNEGAASGFGPEPIDALQCAYRNLMEAKG